MNKQWSTTPQSRTQQYLKGEGEATEKGTTSKTGTEKPKDKKNWEDWTNTSLDWLKRVVDTGSQAVDTYDQIKGKKTGETPTPENPKPKPKVEKSYTAWWIIGGVLLVGGIFTTVYFVRKNK